MDISTTWAASNPAVARLLWVLGLVLATLLVWFLSFCCYSWNHNSSPSLERYLAGRWALDPHPFTLCGCVEACDRFTTDMAAYCDSSSSSQARFYYSLSVEMHFSPSKSGNCKLAVFPFQDGRIHTFQKLPARVGSGSFFVVGAVLITTFMCCYPCEGIQWVFHSEKYNFFF